MLCILCGKASDPESSIHEGILHRSIAFGLRWRMDENGDAHCSECLDRPKQMQEPTREEVIEGIESAAKAEIRKWLDANSDQLIQSIAAKAANACASKTCC